MGTYIQNSDTRSDFRNHLTTYDVFCAADAKRKWTVQGHAGPSITKLLEDL